MPTFSIFSVIAVGCENWRAFRPCVTGLRWANILTLRVCRIAARFLKKQPDWGHGVIVPIQRTLQTFSEDFTLRFTLDSPFEPYALGLLQTARADLSPMGGCPVFLTNLKHGTLSPFESRSSVVLQRGKASRPIHKTACTWPWVQAHRAGMKAVKKG